MIIYYILLEFYLLFAYFFIMKKYHNLLSILFLFQLLIFFTIKDANYFDFNQYKFYFSYADFNNIPGYPELSYSYLSALLKYFNLDFIYISMIYYGLTFYFMYLSIRKYSKSLILSLLIYILMPIFFLSQYITIRQALSISLFIYAILSIKDNKKYLGYSLFLMAVIFHYSSLMAIFIFIVLKGLINTKKSTYFYISIILLAMILSLYTNLLITSVINIINIGLINKYLQYVDMENSQNFIRTLFYSIVYFLTLFLYINEKKVSQINIILFNLYTIGLFITIMGSGNMNVNRLSNFFLIFLIFLLPNIILSKTSKIKFSSRQFILIIILILFSIYYYNGIVSKNEIYLQYRTIFNKG